MKLQINYGRCIVIKMWFGVGRALITALIFVFYHSIMKDWSDIILNSPFSLKLYNIIYNLFKDFLLGTENATAIVWGGK